MRLGCCSPLAFQIITQKQTMQLQRNQTLCLKRDRSHSALKLFRFVIACYASILRACATRSVQIADAVAQRGTAVIHVADFPRLQINHAILGYASRTTASDISISTYDPNDPAKPLELTFSLNESRFLLPSTAYYIGGWVNAYEVYCSFWR